MTLRLQDWVVALMQGEPLEMLQQKTSSTCCTSIICHRLTEFSRKKRNISSVLLTHPFVLCWVLFVFEDTEWAFLVALIWRSY